MVGSLETSKKTTIYKDGKEKTHCVPCTWRDALPLGSAPSGFAGTSEERDKEFQPVGYIQR